MTFPRPAASRALSSRRGFFALLGGSVFTLLFSATASFAAAPKRLLVVTVTKGFRHDVIPFAEETINKMAEANKSFVVDYARTDEDIAAKMTAQALKNYDGVFFCNTTGDLPLPDRAAFLQWIRAGNGFVGAHAAADTFHGYPEFIAMLGGEFRGHGPQVEVNLRVEDPNHPATRHFKNGKIFDEIYLYKNFDRARVHGLLTMDTHPNEGTPGDFPVAWCRMEGRGRVFYTSLGHRKEVWQMPAYQQHLLGGIRWALGLEKGDATPGARASQLSREEVRQGFRPVFNGRDLTGWHLRRADGKASWSVQNGMLVNAGGGTDLVTDARFGDHVVRYEYLVPKGGNSGFYLRGRYEVQVADDGDRKTPSLHSNGAVYGKVAPSALASRPAGEWQQAEATVIGNRVTVVLNGTKIVDNAPIEGVCGLALDDKVGEPGPILLQGDHSAVAYRNIRVKSLRPTVSLLTPPPPGKVEQGYVWHWWPLKNDPVKGVWGQVPAEHGNTYPLASRTR
jgi:type 1 glutamine amidotransferase